MSWFLVNARTQRVVEKRQQALKVFVETFPENKIEINDTDVGNHNRRMPYNYAKGSFSRLFLSEAGDGLSLAGEVNPRFRSKVKKNICR